MNGDGNVAPEGTPPVTPAEGAAPAAEAARPRVPIGQVLFDEVFLWFFLSLVIVLVVYNAWGMMDLVRRPVLP